MKKHKIYDMTFSSIYTMYVNKIERKDQKVSDLNEILVWLTGYSLLDLDNIINSDLTLEQFFDQCPQLNDNAKLITGVICGVRVEDIEDPLMQKIRYMDKLVDELAKGRKMEKILRK